MAKKNRGFPFATLRESVSGERQPGWARRPAPATTLIGALVLLGGLGYAVDYWRGTSPWFLLAGLVLGMVVGFYELVKTTWPR